MLRPLVRMATNEEGEIIRHILEQADEFNIPGLDWSRVWPNWLVAEHKGIIVGCIQVLPGRPLGYIGSLAVLPAYQRLGIAAYLAWGAERVLSNSGVSGSIFVSKNENLIRGLKKHGAYGDDQSYSLMFKPVPRKRAQIDGQRTEGTEAR